MERDFDMQPCMEGLEDMFGLDDEKVAKDVAIPIGTRIPDNDADDAALPARYSAVGRTLPFHPSS